LIENKTIHIVPVEDLIEHDTTKSVFDDFICQCGPEKDIDNEMVIHHAMDGRE